MSEPDRRQDALREATTAAWYGFQAAYRRGDDFEATFADITAAALAADGYDAASLDVFGGDGVFLTVSGSAPSRASLAVVHTIVARDPARRFHRANPFPAPDAAATGQPPLPAAWAGAPLLAPTGAALGCLDLWSAGPREPDDRTRRLLPLLARAAMQVVEERRRIFTGRAAERDGPRPVADRGPAGE